jgi:DnaJ-class molecular chaperone
MNIRKCFEILELDQDASLSEIRQAYLDLVNVWHPDRFIQNPRLREKAENKLRSINTAYEKLTEYLSGAAEVRSGTEAARRASETQAAERGPAEGKQKPDQRPPDAPSRSKTEVAVEKGTQATLTVCYALFKAAKATMADLKHKNREE